MAEFDHNGHANFLKPDAQFGSRRCVVLSRQVGAQLPSEIMFGGLNHDQGEKIHHQMANYDSEQAMWKYEQTYQRVINTFCSAFQVSESSQVE